MEENIHINMYKVHVYERGTVYKLVTEPVGFLSEERWNIYFYVTEDRIYRFWPYIYQDGQRFTFYDDDDLLVSILDTDEKLIENSVIVCQEEDVSVDEEDGEGRYRYCISREEGRITYNRSDVQPNGERGFYEWFIWKEGEGRIFLFPRTMRKIAMLAWIFDECREGQYPAPWAFQFSCPAACGGVIDSWL